MLSFLLRKTSLQKAESAISALNYSGAVLGSYQILFQLWTSELQDALNGRKHGCTAFRGKDLNATTDSYIGWCFSKTVTSGDSRAEI
uniref:Probable serine/threonine-protein kinase BSK3 n=1 Tax=Tanacetum cinerariifolium TaxID=118510 RepID=A0A6L2LTA1_TANCI|nr:probable serine/threonine-protein kinase BSK3 [Tanacetum cinerariifolium]